MPLEVLYRIYEVATEEQAQENIKQSLDMGLCSSTSKMQNNELVMDVMLCDTREGFKQSIKLMYGDDIAFRYNKKMAAGQLYCIIVGEHCYDTGKYFNKITFECSHCGNKVETYWSKPIALSAWEIKNDLYSIESYRDARFCSYRCKNDFVESERKRIKPDDEQEFFIQRYMFTEDVAGYIYKITKKSTGQFYIGQTRYAPVFRWGQHLKTERFDINGICDYEFETLYVVPTGENILEVEKRYIKDGIAAAPDLCLNIVHNNVAEESTPLFT